MQVGWLFIINTKGVIPLDILTEVYISPIVWNKIRQLDKNAELRTDSICLIDCELSVKLMSDDSGRYLLKLI